MNTQILLAFVVCMLCVVLINADDQYNSKYDTFDIESLLSNERVLKNYIKCLMEEGPCTSEGKDFKRVLPEILETSCEKCTPAQQKILRRFLKFVKTNKPEDWKMLISKYDPEGKYQDNVNKFETASD